MIIVNGNDVIKIQAMAIKSVLIFFSFFSQRTSNMIEFGLGASGEENENVRALHTDRRTYRQKDTRTDERTTVNKLSEEFFELLAQVS